MTKHSGQGGKVPLGLASPMPLSPNNNDPILTDDTPNMSTIALLQNGVVRVAGSYLFRNRVDAPIGELDAGDVQAWDLRVDGIDPVADATFPEFQIAPPVAAVNYLFNGTTFDRQASAGAASIAADPVTGAMLVTQPGNWSENMAAAANAQATITRAAGAAGVRHVATSISWSLSSVGTASGTLAVNLRDGATGAGTILWAMTVQIPINFFANFSLGDLSIFGTAATAMTLEFNFAGGVATIESVAFTGYSVG